MISIAENSPEVARPTPVRVLLVDDTPRNLLALEALLDDPLLELARATSGEEALRWVLTDDFAVVVLDVLMPHLDGLETATLIRARERSRHTPIIFVTAAGGDEELVARGYDLGAVDYIVKPIQPAILKSKVAVFAELFRRNRQVKEQAALLARLNADLEARVAARTAELQIAQVLAEQERDRLRQVLEVLPEAVLITDAMGRVISCNAATREVLGMDLQGGELLSPTDIVGTQDPRHLDGTPIAAEDLPWWRSLREGETVRAAQQLARNARDQRDVPVLVNSAPLHDQRKNVSGAVVALQDISALKDLDRQKDEFLATVSHDLKNPLTAISGMAQLLQARAARPQGLDQQRLAEGLETIRATAQQMNHLLTELTDITRLHMDRPLDLAVQPVDLVALVQQVVAAQQQTTELHQVHLQSALPTLEVACDPVRIARVLGNLLSNALKYSPNGGEIVVSLATEQGSDGAWAILKVIDQGVGIPPEDLPHVFERFYRGANAASLVQGSGLGLASVYQIVEQHSGTVAVARNAGAGTAFTVRLPVAGPPASS